MARKRNLATNYSHYYHYAKGAYERSCDQWGDLIKVAAHYTGAAPQNLSQRAVIVHLIAAVKEHLELLDHPLGVVERLLGNIAIDEHAWLGASPIDRTSAVVDSLLRYLTAARIADGDGLWVILEPPTSQCLPLAGETASDVPPEIIGLDNAWCVYSLQTEQRIAALESARGYERAGRGGDHAGAIFSFDTGVVHAELAEKATRCLETIRDVAIRHNAEVPELQVLVDVYLSAPSPRQGGPKVVSKSFSPRAAWSILTASS